MCIYTWGPTGLVARRGVSIHDGHWQEDDPETPEVNEAGWVPGQVNSMCDYVYLADGMGNVRGLVDGNGNVSIQTFDAFGNAQGTSTLPAEETYVDFRCNSDCDYGDWEYSAMVRPPEPVERIQKGSFAWRGGEGSQTDRLSRSVHYHESTPQERVAEAFTRPSSGLVYMQARYYDPAVGRFTQLDPVRYGPETFATGQNNRWTYCANDPINASDPSGRFSILDGLLVGFAIVGIGAGLAMMMTPASFLPGLSLVLAGLSVVLGIIADNVDDCNTRLQLHAIASLLSALSVAIAAVSIPGMTPVLSGTLAAAIGRISMASVTLGRNLRSLFSDFGYPI